MAEVAGGYRSPRWAFMQGFDIGTEGDPYLDRLRIVQTPWFGIYLHHIHRPDVDRDPHDHPWTFASLVLAGSYEEKVWPDKRCSQTYRTRTRRRWTVRTTRLRSAHMITSIDGMLWTLVITGPRVHHWGFWTPDGFTEWEKYVSGNQEAK